jgi:hypothetical protein
MWRRGERKSRKVIGMGGVVMQIALGKLVEPL